MPNIDSAFYRRLRFMVEFPLPDAKLREKVRFLLSFSSSSPVLLSLTLALTTAVESELATQCSSGR